MPTILLISLFIILYTYIGYGVLLYMGINIFRWIHPAKYRVTGSFTPTVTLIVAAYNEAHCIEEKIRNSLALVYPAGKLQFIFVTDGFADETQAIISRYPNIQLLDQPERRGKAAAIDRAMQAVQTEIVVFTDANTLLNADALVYICRHYQNAKTGAVAGEKRIATTAKGDATAGESLYWKYESTLKKWESELYSVMGAAGELFSIRTALYEPLAPDTILDDFMITMKISLRGFCIQYEPAAFATEAASVTIQEELKRKIRIAAGGVQSFTRLHKLLVPFSQPLLSFEYISHRVLRWLVTPYLLVFTYLVNGWLVLDHSAGSWLHCLFVVQTAWYVTACIGWLLDKSRIKGRLIFIPYYFCLMNYAMIAGMIRYIFEGQTVLWEKAKRK